MGIPLLWLTVVRLEGTPPIVETDLTTDALGAKNISIFVSDHKSGLKNLVVSIIKEGKETILIKKNYRPEGFEGHIRGGSVKEETVSVDFNPGKLRLTDGPAILKISASDFSWRRWINGNNTLIEKKITIDTVPPTIVVLSKEHNIYPGGANLVIYKLSEPCAANGVLVGDDFYPGYAGYFKDKSVYMSLFALRHDQQSGTTISLRAADAAGNTTKTSFYYHIGKRGFRKDTLNISDQFLEKKIPEFEPLLKNHSGSLVDKYLEVNRNLRVENDNKIRTITQHTEPQWLWKDVFLRMPNTAPMAGFGDVREYFYGGKFIDKQTHLGIDLASLINSPVPVSNNGKVVFTDYIGIYGNTVIVDHGFGLFSLYSHLSVIETECGKIVKKGDIIGKTGTTGLAGGDHLHFSMLVHHTFVTPIEWWDPGWIANNIVNKINSVKAELKE